LPTIFAFSVEANGKALSPDRMRALQRAVADDLRNSIGGDAPEDTAQSYLIGATGRLARGRRQRGGGPAPVHQRAPRHRVLVGQCRQGTP